MYTYISGYVVKSDPKYKEDSQVSQKQYRPNICPNICSDDPSLVITTRTV